MSDFLEGCEERNINTPPKMNTVNLLAKDLSEWLVDELRGYHGIHDVLSCDEVAYNLEEEIIRRINEL